MSGSADNYILASDKHSQQLTTCNNTRTENDPTHQINPLFAGLVSGPRQAQLYCARQPSCCCCDRCCVLSTDTEQTSAVSVCLSDSHITHSLCVAFLFACLVPRLGLLSVASQLARSTGPLSVRVAVFLLHWIATVCQTLELSKITSECGCDPLSCFQLPTSLHRLSSICIRKSSEISPCDVRTYDATFQGVCQNRLKTVPKRYRNGTGCAPGTPQVRPRYVTRSRDARLLARDPQQIRSTS